MWLRSLGYHISYRLYQYWQFFAKKKKRICLLGTQTSGLQQTRLKIWLKYQKYHLSCGAYIKSWTFTKIMDIHVPFWVPTILRIFFKLYQPASLCSEDGVISTDWKTGGWTWFNRYRTYVPWGPAKICIDKINL